MKRTVCLTPLIFILSFAVPAVAQSTGRVFEGHNIQSEILKEKMYYAVYLPPDYETSERQYPVLYLLHGYSDDQTGWVQFGEVQRIADEAILSGKATPMIIVMPDAKKTFYVNRVDGKYSYEDYFFKELIPEVERKLRCRSKKEFRAVAGLSMGGFGTMLYALKHGDMFAAACPLSAAVFSDENIVKMPYDRYKERFAEFLGEVVAENENRVTDAWKRNSIEYLLKQRVAERKEREEALKKMTEEEKKASAEERRKQTESDRNRLVRFYIDCGDDDFLLEDNLKLPIWFKEARIPMEFRIRDGKHNWTYWREALPEVLSFVSESFHR